MVYHEDPQPLTMTSSCEVGLVLYNALDPLELLVIAGTFAFGIRIVLALNSTTSHSIQPNSRLGTLGPEMAHLHARLPRLIVQPRLLHRKPSHPRSCMRQSAQVEIQYRISQASFNHVSKLAPPVGGCLIGIGVPPPIWLG